MIRALPAGALDLAVTGSCGRQAGREKFFTVGLGFGPCGYGTFLRKEVDLEDILMQAAVWTILPGFLLPQKAVGVQKLSGP